MLDLEGGLKGASRGLEAFNAEPRGLEGGFKGVTKVKGAWRGLKWA